YDGQPNPKHECDNGPERTIRLIVTAEILGIPREQYRDSEPRDCRDGAAPRDPAPSRLFAARSVTVEKRERQANYNQQSRPAGDLDHRLSHTAKTDEIQYDGDNNHYPRRNECKDDSQHCERQRYDIKPDEAALFGLIVDQIQRIEERLHPRIGTP